MDAEPDVIKSRFVSRIKLFYYYPLDPISEWEQVSSFSVLTDSEVTLNVNVKTHSNYTLDPIPYTLLYPLNPKPYFKPTTRLSQPKIITFIDVQLFA